MSQNFNPWASLAAQVADLPQAEAPRARVNPHPPGQPWPGSATEAVLTFLRASPGRFYRHGAIVTGVGRSKASVDWALIYLRRVGLVESTPDTIRNAQYMRYRARPAGAQEGAMARE